MSAGYYAVKRRLRDVLQSLLPGITVHYGMRDIADNMVPVVIVFSWEIEEQLMSQPVAAATARKGEYFYWLLAVHTGATQEQADQNLEDQILSVIHAATKTNSRLKLTGQPDLEGIEIWEVLRQYPDEAGGNNKYYATMGMVVRVQILK